MLISYTDLSVEDLNAIAEHISKDSFTRAFDFLTKLRKKITLLSTFPQMGVACKTKGIDQNCRIMIVESYLVFYSITEKAIHINRILHCSINYQEQL